MSIYKLYKPYFYIIQHKKSGMFYAGAKWAADANPITFMIEGGYSTSSNIINNIVNNEGLKAFIIRKIRTFETALETQNHETKFLRRIDARNHPLFLNGHNNEGLMDTIARSKTLLNLYGVENISQVPFIKELKKKTCLENYGVEHPLQSPVILNKIKETCLEKYGVEHTLQSPVILNKIKETCLEKYGVDHYSKTEEFQIKYKKTSLERFGAESNLSLEDTISLRKEVMMERYGVEYPFQDKNIKDKAIKTISERYGGHQMYDDNVKLKYRETCLENYGVDHPSKTEEAKIRHEKMQKEKKSRQIVLVLKIYKEKHKLKFGSGWVLKSDEYLEDLLDQIIKKYGKI